MKKVLEAQDAEEGWPEPSPRESLFSASSVISVVKKDKRLPCQTKPIEESVECEV
jgi:hypothetical protein